jgi:sec-independent protein translocase protein TatB
VFNSLGWGEISVLIVLGLFVFGPERLPGMAAEAGRALRKLRLYAKGLTADLKAELGPEVGDLDLASLNPKTFVRKHLFEDDDDEPMPGYAALHPSEPAPWDPDTT